MYWVLRRLSVVAKPLGIVTAVVSEGIITPRVLLGIALGSIADLLVDSRTCHDMPPDFKAGVIEVSRVKPRLGIEPNVRGAIGWRERSFSRDFCGIPIGAVTVIS